MSQVLGLDTGAVKGGKSPLLQVDNLSVDFFRGSIRKSEPVRAVQNASLKIYQGEILSLVGESGSGKTTIARCLMCLTEATSGKLMLGSTDIRALSGGSGMRNYRKQVQMIYQDPFESLNPRDDVFSTISTPIRLLTGEKHSEVVTETVSKLLEEVGLIPSLVMKKFPHQLSGGERQRVNIARALAPNPSLLIADEPITMLDASQRLTILSLLMKLKQDRNLSILLITHDLASAKLMSDRCIIMFRGRIVESGPTDEILNNPYHPYTQLILDTLPKGKVGSKRTLDYKSSTEEVKSGCNFRLRCKYAAQKCQDEDPMLEEKSASRMAACHFPLNVA